jgi:hypothetical protein
VGSLGASCFVEKGGSRTEIIAGNCSGECLNKPARVEEAIGRPQTQPGRRPEGDPGPGLVVKEKPGRGLGRGNRKGETTGRLWAI